MVDGGETLVSIGKIVRPHGIRGEVKVSLEIKGEGYINNGLFLYLEKGKEKGEGVRVEKVGFQGQHVIMKLCGYNSRNDAESLQGAVLKIQRNKLPKLSTGSYYVSDLIGLDVETDRGEKIGSLVQVVTMPMQDLYVINAEGREIFIPAVKNFIRKIDLDKRVMIIHPMEGLLD